MRILLLAVTLIGLTNSGARADASVPLPREPPPSCASAAQLAALDRYCAGEAAPSEQRACRIVRRALAHCTAEAERGDGVESFRVPNPSPKRAVDQWILELERHGDEYRLVRFVRELDDDCDCC